jgi:nickel transport protein
MTLRVTNLPAVTLGLLPALLVLAATAPAHSHAIESSLERLSSLTDQLVLDSRFGNGEPADDAVVRLIPPGGTPIEVGRTDASGQLRFRLPQNATAAWEVQVDRGPGHRDYLELPDSSSTPSRSPLPAARSVSGLGPLLVGISLAGGALAGGAVGGAAALRRRRSTSHRPGSQR